MTGPLPTYPNVICQLAMARVQVAHPDWPVRLVVVVARREMGR